MTLASPASTLDLALAAFIVENCEKNVISISAIIVMTAGMAQHAPQLRSVES